MMNLHANLTTINGTAERMSALPFLTNNLMEQVMADENLTERDRKIIQFYLDGNSVPRAVKVFGVGRTRIYEILDLHGVVRRTGKDYRPQSMGKEKDIIVMYLSHVSMENVGKNLGVCAATVSYVLKTHGVQIRPPGGSGEKCSNWRGGVTKDKKHMRSVHNKYRNERRKVDPLYKLNAVLRARIATFFRRNVKLELHKVAKWNKSVVLLGASVEVIKKHIESQFRDGMTWENHGMHWHIDHRKPLASGSTKEELEKLFHYTNLQPLLVMENKKKSNKLNWSLEKMRGQS